MDYTDPNQVYEQLELMLSNIWHDPKDSTDNKINYLLRKRQVSQALDLLVKKFLDESMKDIMDAIDKAYSKLEDGLYE